MSVFIQKNRTGAQLVTQIAGVRSCHLAWNTLIALLKKVSLSPCGLQELQQTRVNGDIKEIIYLSRYQSS